MALRKKRRGSANGRRERWSFRICHCACIFDILSSVMSKYELTLVIDGEFSPAKKKAVVKKVEELVTFFKGKVVKSDDWGKMDLAYKINKTSTGTFVFHEIELSPADVSKISLKLEREDDILRFLLVKKEEK